MKPGVTIKCAECGADMVQRTSKFGPFYGCSRFPLCRGTHGANKLTGAPLGTPADTATKAARVKAHAAFDRLWRGKDSAMSRTDAYAWLASVMKLSVDDAHIARFTAAQCEQITTIVEEYLRLIRGLR